MENSRIDLLREVLLTVFVSETFLDDRVSWIYARTQGILFGLNRIVQHQPEELHCYKEKLLLVLASAAVPNSIKILIFKVIDTSGQGTPLYGC